MVVSSGRSHSALPPDLKRQGRRERWGAAGDRTGSGVIQVTHRPARPLQDANLGATTCSDSCYEIHDKTRFLQRKCFFVRFCLQPV